MWRGLNRKMAVRARKFMECRAGLWRRPLHEKQSSELLVLKIQRDHPQIEYFLRLSLLILSSEVFLTNQQMFSMLNQASPV